MTIVYLLMLMLPAGAAAQTAAAEAPPIVANPGRYGPYYHLRMVLTAESVRLGDSDRQVRDGGQFEIRLRPDHFPIPAPACSGALILRMPWSSSLTPGAAEKIQAKAAVLDRIRRLESNPGERVPVVVELNPYVRVTHTSPLRVALTGCNVFFRHALGGYVDHLEPIASGRQAR